LEAAILWTENHRGSMVGKAGPKKVHLFTVSYGTRGPNADERWDLTTTLPGYGAVTRWTAASKEEAMAKAERAWVKWLAGVGVVARELGVTP